MKLPTLCDLPSVMIIIFAVLPVGSLSAQTGELVSNPVGQAYMQEHGVDAAEADRRFATLTDIAEVEAQLRDKFPQEFGGLYVRHEPQFQVIVKMTGNGQGLVKQVTSNPLFVVEKAERPIKQMLQLRDRAAAALVARKIAFDSDVDIWTGKVYIDVIDFESANAAIATVIKGQSYVEVRKVDALPTNTATVYGGRQGTGTIQYCTTGFAVKNATRSGILTAGHCDNTMAVAGSTLSLGGEMYYSHTTRGADAQWMVNSGNTYPNEIYT